MRCPCCCRLPSVHVAMAAASSKWVLLYAPGVSCLLGRYLQFSGNRKRAVPRPGCASSLRCSLTEKIITHDWAVPMLTIFDSNEQPLQQPVKNAVHAALEPCALACATALNPSGMQYCLNDCLPLPPIFADACRGSRLASIAVGVAVRAPGNMLAYVAGPSLLAVFQHAMFKVSMVVLLGIQRPPAVAVLCGMVAQGPMLPRRKRHLEFGAGMISKSRTAACKCLWFFVQALFPITVVGFAAVDVPAECQSVVVGLSCCCI